MDDVIWRIEPMAFEGVVDGRHATFFPALGANGAWIIKSDPAEFDRAYEWKRDSLA